MKSWEEMSKALASDAAVSNAEARLGASGVIFVDAEIDREAAAAGGISALATGITPEMLAEAPHPDLEPYFDEAAGTYVVALPVERWRPRAARRRAGLILLPITPAYSS